MFVEVASASVHCTVLSPELEDTVVLLHGGAAHIGWWHAVAPVLAARRRVVAVDLSGHGDSDHRSRYDLDLWADEVAAVTEQAGGGRAVLIGHSLGGAVALATAARHPATAQAIVLVDSALWRPGTQGIERGALRRYASRAEAVGAFRLMPPQPLLRPDVIARVAERSVALRDGGWTWKFDPAILTGLDPGRLLEALRDLDCPVTEIRGALSDHIDDDAMAILVQGLGRPVPVIDVDGAYHHVMLDQPEALTAVLLEVLDGPEAAVA